jgi:hypothetical protein
MSPSARDWEQTARSLRIRYDEAVEQINAYHHAINLLANDSVFWFFSNRSANKASHEFGIGVARNVSDPGHSPFYDSTPKSVPVVIWRTDFGSGNYVTVFTLAEFKRQADEWERAGERDLELIGILRQAIGMVDDSLRVHKTRIGKTPASDSRL